ncbi:MAG TPA: protein-L-isoaspartate(D-aspartate) O-methyltransferase, partial [Bryobacteraceae bacterium]|nr:protein-L-isoaspartate(D-aspartate) O-methyltransferase [Bryobacteraceae bacterium]
EQFIPAGERVRSYRDEPAPIGGGQTISQPYMTALMAELLELHGDEKVLEVGTGLGYHAAVLGALAAWVVSIELLPELAAQARENLERTGRAGNVKVICGDGSQGWLEEAPYDAISVAAGSPEVPAALLEQLADPGRLVIPVGELTDQELRVVTRVEGKIEWRGATMCRFVPLRGEQGWR